MVKHRPDHNMGVRYGNNLNGPQTSYFGPSNHLNNHSSPPPAKRPKVGEHAHTEARFVVEPPSHEALDRSTPRKRSIDDISDSQPTSLSQSSQTKGSSSIQKMVPEFRHVQQFTTPSPRKRARTIPPKLHIEPKQHVKNRESMTIDGVSFMSTQDDSDGEVDIVNNNPKTDVASRDRAENLQGIDVIGRRFQRNMIKSVDSSPDELAPEKQDIKGKQSIKRHVPHSPSLSKKGNIPPTDFAFSTAPEVDLARKTIGERLRILRAVSGDFKYEASKANSADECFLKVGKVSSILIPADLDGKEMGQYSYCGISLKGVNKIFASTGDCSIVSINRSNDPTKSWGAKLMYEFQSREELRNFLDWVKLYKEKEDLELPKTIATQPDKLEKMLEHMMGEANRSTAIRDIDVIGGNKGDDIKLIEHNRAVHPESIHRPHIATNHTKTKDLMMPSAATPPSTPKSMVISDTLQHQPPQRQNVQRQNPQRQARTTRSTFVLKDPSESPKLPEPDGWSVQNKGWENQWRNSLVFPPRGKSRATVDKEDILRLDEGEFLNDNLLTFYLRYLQHTLEATRPDLAERIYFQNTYFYEKLKSPKTTGGINYESVKGWTSKVDLFTKDFIIVPINEYTHWYVAIIYNAPKVILPPDKKEVSDSQTANTITIEEDVADSEKVSRASSQSRRPDESTDVGPVASAAPIDVTNQLSRMSIGSPAHSNSETKQTIATKPESNEAEVQLISNNQDVKESVNKSDSRAELKQIRPSDGNPPGRKGKRPSTGPRKFDPSVSRIITLDSLSSPHGPACRSLKAYMIAELRDKKGLEISPMGVFGGTAAKNTPEQTNYCDCGVYLLGYIEKFLEDPDRFVYSLLQHDPPIDWTNLKPSKIRNDIRDLIFKLQKEQQDREDAHKQEKKKAALLKKQHNQEPKQQETGRNTSVTQMEDAVVKGGNKEVTPRAKSPAPQSPQLKPKPKPISDSEEVQQHIPGSYPVSPVRVEAKVSPVTTDVRKIRQSKSPSLLSSLSGTVSGSSPDLPVLVDSEIPCQQEQKPEPAQGHSSPKPVSLVEDEELIEPLLTTLESYADPQRKNETETASPYFAGRGPGDRKPSARLRSPQPDTIDISD